MKLLVALADSEHSGHPFNGNVILLRHRQHKLPMIIFENKVEYETQGALTTPLKVTHSFERFHMCSGKVKRILEAMV